MSGNRGNIRWGVEQRLEFIEFRLFWEGGINRADIQNYFGVSTPQASKDLSQYQELAPNNVQYDKSNKKYIPTDKFKPRFTILDSDRYMAQLVAVTDQKSKKEDTWLTHIPNMSAMPVPHRKVSVGVLRAMLAAIRNESSLEIRYQSMSKRHADPIWRKITPHAFGSDGFRWHVRAFCHIDCKFKDFLLSRCLDVRKEDAPAARAEDDEKWNQYFNVVLMPNPKLSKNQQSVIAQDYEMVDSVIEVPVRKALLYYFSKRLRLDVAKVLDNPKETPVVVKNRADFDIALKEAMS